MTCRWICKVLFFFISIVFLNLLTVPAVFSAADDVPRITVQELKAKMDKGDDLVVVDVRTGNDYENSKLKIKGAVRISIVKIEDRYKELPKDKEIILYCTWHNEATSARAAQILLDKGFKKVSALKGGFNAWLDAGYPTEPK